MNIYMQRERDSDVVWWWAGERAIQKKWEL